MSEHTPGPWKTRETEEHWGRINVHIEGPDDLELACAYQRTSSENKANARLIASAPEMLAALEELLDIEGPQPGTAAWADKTRALIAKAKGEI